LELKALLQPFGITRFYTDGWGAYRRHLDPDKHTVGKQHTQKIERKHTTLRARIKRLTRKTICFSKSILGRPNRFLVVDRFLDSRCQSRLSYAWWRSLFKEKRFIQTRDLRTAEFSITV
jgi:IS1 transposase